ncbi:MAG: class II aldolase/adducin family protein [Pirellulaceae bacterium]
MLPISVYMEPADWICDIGKRLDQRGYTAANDGNISVRLDDDRFLCTPTMHSKGLMTPDDLCVVDGEGNQISGDKNRSSEIMLHLEIYRHRPDVNCVVHCHPPHATAFAVAREAIPQCVLPEVEIFLGEVPIAPYATPGSPEFRQTIVPFVQHSNVIVLGNHGTVSFGRTPQLAYWFTEILDAYCRVLILARQLGGINYISDDHCRELLAYKQEWGFSDPRIYGDDAGCNVCGHQAFGEHWSAAGVGRRAFPHPSLEVVGPESAQTLPALSEDDIERIAEKVASKLAKLNR